MRSQPDQFRVQRPHTAVVAAHALAELDEGMLDVTRMLLIVQEFADLLAGELAPKPGVPPEQERHEDDQPGGEEKQRAIPRGHFVMRRRSRHLRGILPSKFWLITIFWRGWRIGHVFSWSLTLFGGRSEERRVGKECRSRWCTEDG